MPIPLLCDSKCLAMGLSFSWKGKGTTGILPGMAVPVSEFWPSDHDRRQAPLGPDCAQPLLGKYASIIDLNQCSKMVNLDFVKLCRRRRIMTIIIMCACIPVALLTT
jgi:hypothetical protein